MLLAKVRTPNLSKYGLFDKNCFGIKLPAKVDMPLDKETKLNLAY